MDLNAELTPRQEEIAELLVWGKAKKEVADRLQISTSTVENTARTIYKKIGIQKAAELCVWWFCVKCGVAFKTFAVTALLLITFNYECNNEVVRVFKPVKTAKATRATRGRRRADIIDWEDYLEA